MGFYEFKKGYEYYALFVAKTEEKAIVGYIDEIEGGTREEYEEQYENEEPVEITKEEALERYKKANIDGCSTDEEKEKEFNKTLDDFKDCENEEYILLLIDGSLL